MAYPRYKKVFIIGISIFAINALAVAWWLWVHQTGRVTWNESAESIQVGKLLRTIDSTYWETPLQSIGKINTLISLSAKANNTDALAMGLYYKAACFVILERYDSAFILCHTALKFAEDNNNELVAGKMKVVLANYFLAKNEFSEANKYLMDALAVFEKQGSMKDMANVLNGFGLLYYNLKEPDKAINYYYRVIALSKDPDKKRQESVAYLNISNCYRNKSNLKMTLYYLGKAMDGFRELNDSVFIMMCTLNRGIVAIDKGEKEKGLFDYFKVMDFAERMNKKVLLGHTLFNIANVYYQSGNLSLASKYFRESIDVYRSIPNKDGEKNVLLQLSVIEQAKNNWKAAFDYYDRYIGIRDSILNTGLLKNINDLQWKYNFQKKESETAVIKKKIEAKQRETVILMVLFSFIILVVSMFILLIRKQMAANNRINELEKLRLQSEIELKNKELTSSSMQLVSKNEILDSISGITESFYSRKSMDDECYRQLRGIFRESQDQEREWEHFKRLFEEVHTDFFKNLKLTCPEITESELRLCAYLKINLQNKEIAKILNVTPDSLKTIRYRIRKKLNLQKEAVLEEYLRNI